MSWSYLGIGKGKKFLKWGCLECPAYTPPQSQMKKRWMDDNIYVYGWVIGRKWSSLGPECLMAAIQTPTLSR